jgi:hypothetical protein
MSFVLRAVGAVLGLAALAVIGLLVAARFTDGPIAIVAGGPFRSGELVTVGPDWAFVQTVSSASIRRARARPDPGARWQGLHPLRLHGHGLGTALEAVAARG